MAVKSFDKALRAAFMAGYVFAADRVLSRTSAHPFEAFEEWRSKLGRPLDDDD